MGLWFSMASFQSFAEVGSHVGHVIILWLEPVGNYLIANLDDELKKRSAVSIVGHSHFKGYVHKVFHAVEVLFEGIPVVCRHVHLGINALATHINTAETVPLSPLSKELVAKSFGIFNDDVFIKRESFTFKVFPSNLAKSSSRLNLFANVRFPEFGSMGF